MVFLPAEAWQVEMKVSMASRVCLMILAEDIGTRRQKYAEGWMLGYNGTQIGQKK